MVELMFVNVSHPVQLSDNKARRQVRSHISKRQHEQKRIAIERAVDKIQHEAEHQHDGIGISQHSHNSTPCLSVVVTDTSPEELTSPTVYGHLIRLEGNVIDSCDAISIPPGSSSGATRPSDYRATSDTIEPSEQHTTHIPTSLSTKGWCTSLDGIPISEERRSSYQGNVTAGNAEHVPRSLAITSHSTHDTQLVLRAVEHAQPPQIPFSLHDPSDELQPFAKQMGSSVTAILFHFNKVLHVMESISEPQYALPPGYTRSLHNTSMRTEPAARAAVLLAAAANIRIHQPKPFDAACLYGLRGHALSCVRSALDDPERRNSDAVILAVSSIMVAELFFGRREDYEVHKRGLVQVRRARGAMVSKFMDEYLACICDVTIGQICGWTSDAFR